MPDKTIRLRSAVVDGHQCILRDPPQLIARRPDCDRVLIVNNEPANGITITVTLDSLTAGNLFINPPTTPQDLDPQGQPLILFVKSPITRTVSSGFTTDPTSCHHHDQGDIIIQP
jgi:hypothetical protein